MELERKTKEGNKEKKQQKETDRKCLVSICVTFTDLISK